MEDAHAIDWDKTDHSSPGGLPSANGSHYESVRKPHNWGVGR
jgi:hypothetical protein